MALPWNLAQINVEPAWAVTQGDPSVVVGIVDSGVDVNHPALSPRAEDRLFSGWGGPHGTLVAGVVAGASDGDPIGVAPRCRLRSYRCADNAGRIAPALVLAAIRQAVEDRVAILNLSLGAHQYTGEFEEVIALADDRGIVLVVAAGNDGRLPDVVGGDPYPAADRRVLAVGATTRQGGISGFSQVGDWIKLVAPGGDTPPGIGADPADLIRGPMPGGGMGGQAGTSFAAPHVAGVAALLLSVNSALTSREVADILLATARPIGPRPLPNEQYGHGLVDAGAAVRRAAGLDS